MRDKIQKGRAETYSKQQAKELIFADECMQGKKKKRNCICQGVSAFGIQLRHKSEPELRDSIRDLAVLEGEEGYKAA